VLFGKGVDGANFLAGFTTGSINTLTIFTVGSTGRDEESATVLTLLVQYISLGKIHKFIAAYESYAKSITDKETYLMQKESYEVID